MASSSPPSSMNVYILLGAIILSIHVTGAIDNSTENLLRRITSRSSNVTVKIAKCRDSYDCPLHATCIRGQCRCNLGYLFSNITEQCVQYKCSTGSDCRTYFAYSECNYGHECICDSSHSLDETSQTCKSPNSPDNSNVQVPLMIIYILIAVVGTILLILVFVFIVFWCYLTKRKSFMSEFPDTLTSSGRSLEPSTNTVQDFFRQLLRGNYRRFGTSFSSQNASSDPCDPARPCPAPPPYEYSSSSVSSDSVRVVGGGCGGSSSPIMTSTTAEIVTSVDGQHSSSSIFFAELEAGSSSPVSPLSPKVNI